MIRTIGIDIGSQKTIIVADDGEIVRTSTGSVSFPTLIAFQDKTPRNIGDEATSGDTIVPMVNLLAGKTVDEIKKSEPLSLAKITLSEADDSIPKIVVTYGANEDTLSTTSLLGLYICKIWDRISQVYGSEVNLAISTQTSSSKETVRAYFDACAIAGLDTSKVTVVDAADSIVAAYSRKLSAIRGAERTALDNKLVALIEVGHVQSSVIVVRVNPLPTGEKNPPSTVTKLAVEHDDNLGCLHFDSKLFEHLVKVAETKMQKCEPKIQLGTKRGNRLLSGCERLRKLLSQLTEGKITVENLSDNGDISFSMKRDEFTEISSELLARLKALINKAVSGAIGALATLLPPETEISDEDKAVKYVEIFGGGLRMPVVQNLITDIFGQDVALGAKLDDGSVAIGSALVVNRATDSALAALTASINPEAAPVEETKPTTSSAVIFKLSDVSGERGLNQTELDQARAKEIEMQVYDTEMRQLLAVRNSMESYILEMRGAPKRKFGELIDASSLNSILDESEGWIWDNSDANLSQYSEKEASLKASVQGICQKFFEAVEADRIDIEKKLEEEAAKAAAEKPEEDEDHDNRKLKKADRMRLVVKNKDEGTELFKGGNFRPAAARYQKALSHAAKFFDLSPEDMSEVKNIKISLYLNLATCYLKMDNLDQMQRNIEDALALDNKNAKAYFKRSQYYEAKKDLEKAYDDAKKCQSLMDIEDKLVKQTVDRLAKEIGKLKEKEKKMWSKAFS